MLVVAALSPMARAAPQAIRMGVYPGNTFSIGKYVGLTGTNAVDPFGDRALDRMVELAGGQPFDVHVYAEWRHGVPPELDAFTTRVIDRGLSVNMALKYVPPRGRNGDIKGFARWVAGVVAARPQVRVWQITNEANVIGSPDTDGGSIDAVGALIEGVKAAAAAATPSQQVGFNWFYRLDPVSDRRFWAALKIRGGKAFHAAVDYAGVDIYAGTYIPPLYAIDDEAAFRHALRYVRHTLMPLAGLGADVPLYVQEFGYPTLDPLLRTEKQQADARSRDTCGRHRDSTSACSAGSSWPTPSPPLATAGGSCVPTTPRSRPSTSCATRPDCADEAAAVPLEPDGSLAGASCGRALAPSGSNA